MSTVVCGVLMLASLVSTRLWCRGSLFNPLTAFFGIWSASLALYELDSVLGVFKLRLSALAESMLSSMRPYEL